MRDSLDEALLRQMEKSILLDTVYDERRISEEAMQALLRERCVEALCAIRRVLDEDTQDPECFGKIEEIDTRILLQFIWRKAAILLYNNIHFCPTTKSEKIEQRSSIFVIIWT